MRQALGIKSWNQTSGIQHCHRTTMNTTAQTMLIQDVTSTPISGVIESR